MQRLDRVRVVTSREVVEISWVARRELLGRLPWDAGGANVVGRFTAAGATRLVELDQAAEQLLLDVVVRWLEEAGAGGVPTGIVELRSSLGDERDHNLSARSPG